MSTDPLNTGKAFTSMDGKGIVRSVSVIFHIPDKGYLLCSEMRKGFPDPKIRTHESHMVGGKVDLNDTSVLRCGLREFCEETGYLSPGSNGRWQGIKDTIDSILVNFDKCPTVKWDHCVSLNKRLYNRFYVINLDNCPNFEFFCDFVDFFSCWEKNIDLPLDSPLESMFFWNEGDTLEHKPTSLLKTFISNLPVISDYR